MFIEDDELNKKIKTIDDLETIVNNLKSQGKKIVLCHGVFDGGAHPGHIQYLTCAKKQGDILIATVTRDAHVDRGPGRPIIGEQLRAETLGSLSCVDYVAINPYPTAVETIRKLRPDTYAKGEEFAKLQDETGKIKPEVDAIHEVGGKMYFTQGIVFSSSNLINGNDALNVYPPEAREFLRKFKNTYTSEMIKEQIHTAKSLNVLVIGETIIDEYHYCQPMGKSPKENIIAYQFLREERFGGGAVATANNVASFCNQVELVSLLGQSSLEDNEFVLKALHPKVTPRFFYTDDRQTIKKRRGIDPVSYRKLFGEYFLKDHLLPSNLEERIVSNLVEKIKDFDLVIVSDYGHGLLTQPIIDQLCENAKFLAVNAQTNSSNIGFNTIDKYPRADYVCIDHAEARIATRDRFSPIPQICDKVSSLGNYLNISITEGHKGSLTYSLGEKHYLTPVFSQYVVDTLGAGDAYFSITAPLVAQKCPMEIVGFVGNAAGALAVSSVGNSQSLQPSSFYKFITTLLK